MFREHYCYSKTFAMRCYFVKCSKSRTFTIVVPKLDFLIISLFWTSKLCMVKQKLSKDKQIQLIFLHSPGCISTVANGYTYTYFPWASPMVNFEGILIACIEQASLLHFQLKQPTMSTSYLLQVLLQPGHKDEEGMFMR